MTLVTRNYRCPYGELDRVMRHGDTLVFVEVKTRRSLTYGSPAAAVTAFKRRQISRAAACFLQEHALDDIACRFDVVEALAQDGPPRIRHLPAAFEVEEWD